MTEIEHITELARAFRINVVIVTSEMDCRGDPDTRTVQILLPDNPANYGVGLHELGHLEAPGGSMIQEIDFILKKLKHPNLKDWQAARLIHRLMGLKLAEEDAAWAWARHYAMYWTPMMDAVEQFSRESYKNLEEVRQWIRKQGFVNS